MRLMGIDFGTKRVGVALSSEDGTMAFPHAVLPNDAALLDAIEALIDERSVGEIVIGHSLDRDGEANAVQAAIEAFIGDMTLRAPIPINLEPEQYTTQEAKRIQGKNEKTDASAAALILNSYITRTR